MSLSTEAPILSLVVPMYDEEEGIGNFFGRLVPLLEGIVERFEIICVNDGSSDRTLELLKARAAHDSRIKILDLSRNFGTEAALTAGLDIARGDAVIPIDADLQDPPELIGDMLALWQQGYDVVLAARSDRSSDRRMKRLSALWFYKIIGRFSEVPIPENVGDFRLMDRQVVEALKQLPERSRFMKGIFAWLGFRTTQVTFSRAARQSGEAKHNYRSLFRLAVDGLISFTVFPLRIWTLIGFCISILAGIFMFVIIGDALFYGRETPGYASLMTVILLFNGLLMINMGVMSEYIARIFIEVKKRPLYLVRETVNLDETKRRDADGS